MAAISIVPNKFREMHLSLFPFKFTQLTTADWLNFSGVKGVYGVLLSTTAAANNTATGATSWNHGQMLANGAISATATSLAIDGAGAGAGTLARQLPYYARTPGGEIIEVIGETAPEAAASTLTIRRGCLGTTAATIADNDYLSILNQIVIANAAVGPVTGIAIPMEEEAGAKIFA